MTRDLLRLYHHASSKVVSDLVWWTVSYHQHEPVHMMEHHGVVTVSVEQFCATAVAI